MDTHESIKDRLYPLTSKVRCRTTFCAWAAQWHPLIWSKMSTSSSDTAIPDFLDIQCVTIPVALTNVIEWICWPLQTAACLSGCGGRSSPPLPWSLELPASPLWQAGPGTGPSMTVSPTGSLSNKFSCYSWFFRRYYAHHTPMAVNYHKRDMQHSKPSIWQKYVR